MSKKLGFGLMRLPLTDASDFGKIDLPQVQKMADTFLERGFTYFDTAWMYHNFKSEVSFKAAVTDRYPREAFTIATKMYAGMVQGEDGARKMFEQQLENCGVSFFDYYLFHDLSDDNYVTAKKLELFEYLQSEKAAGRIKKLGFSCHDTPERLDEILTEYPYFDFVQIQLNYLDWDNPGIRCRECCKVIRKHGKPIFVMEPVKGGTLANLPAEAEAVFHAVHPDWSNAEWAIRFAAGQEGVEMVLSGMSSLEQLQDNTSYMQDFVPLNEEELAAVWKVRKILLSTDSIPCTGCRYCVEVNTCPMGILIPDYFALYNNLQRNQAPSGSPRRATTTILSNTGTAPLLPVSAAAAARMFAHSIFPFGSICSAWLRPSSKGGNICLFSISARQETVSMRPKALAGHCTLSRRS